VQNLHKEGIVDRVFCVGDVMLDAALYFGSLPATDARVVRGRGFEPGQYLLATIHRASNTDSSESLKALFRAFGSLDEPIVFPVHPRTRHAMAAAGIAPSPNVQTIDPVGYLEMLALEKQARMILTDSGGVQKEAFFFGVPCVTLRTETEWTELVEAGWNRVVGLETDAIVDAVRQWTPATVRPELFGKGDAANRIAELLRS
jgi:UDP-N-acetylglucosamine 2-epimerase